MSSRSTIILLLLGVVLFTTASAAPTHTLINPWSGFNGAEVQFDDEMKRTMMNIFSNLVSAFAKKIGENGEIQSDELAKTFMSVFSNLFSAMSHKIENGEIQSGEFAQSFLNIISNLMSGMGKNSDSSDAGGFGQTLFSTLLSLLGNIGNSQNVESQYSTTLQTGQRNDLKLHDNTAAMLEAFRSLSEEAKEAAWPMLLGSLPSGFFNRLVDN